MLLIRTSLKFCTTMIMTLAVIVAFNQLKFCKPPNTTNQLKFCKPPNTTNQPKFCKPPNTTNQPIFCKPPNTTNQLKFCRLVKSQLFAKQQNWSKLKAFGYDNTV